MQHKLCEIEQVERTALEMVVTAIREYLPEAVQVWRHERDEAKDIAEDITREALDQMGLPRAGRRLYGTVDFKKPTWIFNPRATRCALFVDSKAEERAFGVARLQISQTSLEVRMVRQNEEVRVPGGIAQEVSEGGETLLSVTIVVKYHYAKLPEGRELKRVTVACIPNGALQEKYNPTPKDGIWRAGPDAPTLEENFRMRLSFEDLAEKAEWRVRRLEPPGLL